MPPVSAGPPDIQTEVKCMDLGYFMMPLHPPGTDMTQSLEDDMEQIVMLDRLGYKEAWIGEHFTAQWENIPAPDQFIAMALAKTKNIVLATGVTCMPNHNPFMIAHRIAQLDHLAKGRFIWGVGSGGFTGDFQVFGIDPKSGDQRTMTREAVDLVIKLWNDPKPGLYESKYWRFTVPEPDDSYGLRYHVKPYQMPHPPIGMAGVSPKSDTLVLAGERGYIPMSINTVPTATLAGHWQAVETGAKTTGRIADRSKWRIAREVYVAETTEKARKEAVEGTMARDFSEYFLKMMPKINMLNLLKVDKSMPDSDVTIDYLLDNIWVVGNPDEVVAKLSKLYHEVGGFGVLLTMGHEWEPREQWVRSHELMVHEVLPRLPDLG
jgi:alkanesulfonate monooxygenase SsuD/methylene tetrahydromethanopterin reductase-like flavin-dependent oxidoreductase (luciferase family)